MDPNDRDTEGKDDLSDQDMMKIASDAADKLTATAVMEILATFEVPSVASLDQPQRIQFAKLVRQAVADETGEALGDEIPF